MTTGSETWTGTNGTAWPSPWTTSGGAGSAATIQSNKGQLTAPTSTFTATQAKYGSAQDIDYTVTVTASNPLTEQYLVFVARMDDWASAVSGNAANGYNFEFRADTGALELYYTIANARTSLATATFSPTAGVDFKVRVQVWGAHLRCKMWSTAGGEPGTWAIDVDNSQYVASGVWGWAFAASTANKTISYDDLSWDDTATGAFKRQLVGTQVSSAAATTTTISYTGAEKPAVGDLVVVYGSRDNDNNDPLTGDSFSDGEGNTYTRIVDGSDLVTANAGNVGVMFYSVCTSAWTGTNTLTWTHPSRLAAMRVEQWKNIAGLTASSTGISSAGAPSAARSGCSANDVVLAMEAIEYSTAGTSTGDSDTTSGSWSAVQGPTATTGTTLAAVKVISQYKFVTGSSTQTYNPTHSVTTNVSSTVIVADFAPVSGGSTATLDDAAVTVAANSLSGSRTPTAGSVTVAASNAAASNGATLAAAAVTVTAYNLTATSGAVLDDAAGSVAANKLAVGSTPAAASVSVAANAFTATSSATLAAAAVTGVANVLVPASGATLAAAAVTVAANNITIPPTLIDLDDASVSVAASNLSVGATPAAGAVSGTANALSGQRTAGTATVSVTANDPDSSLRLGTATIAVAASNLTNGRTPTAAAVSTTANNVKQTFAPVLAAATVTGTGIDFDAVILGAEPLGTGRTPTAAASTVTANADKQTFAPVAAAAAGTVTAYGLSKISNTIGTATVSVAAANPGTARNAGTATVSTTAYGTTPPSSLILPAAFVVATPTLSTFNLLPTDRTLGTGTVTTAANTPGYLAVTATAAAGTATAYDPDIGERLPAAATVTTTVGQLTIGQTFAVASIAVLASNLTGDYRTLTAANVAAQGFDLYLTPTGSLSPAAATVTAYPLNALNTLGTAAGTVTGNPLESTRTTTAATTTATAAGLSTQDTLGYGTVSTTAYDMARESPGQYALGYGLVTTATFNLLPLIQASTGLALATLAAGSFTYQQESSSGQVDVTVEAGILSTELSAEPAVSIDITAYGLSQTPPPTGSAAVTVDAYALINGAASVAAVVFVSAVFADVRRTEIEADVQISPDLVALVR